MKILLLGAGGLLGNYFLSVFGREELVVGDLPEWDITDELKINQLIELVKPEVIVNCAAFTDVEAAESQSELVQKINAIGPQILAKAAKNLGATLVHFSTDYVFDGRKTSGYNEDDPPRPLNVYGLSKYQGEQNIVSQWTNYYIVRTSWLFGGSFNRSSGKASFIEKMLQLAKNQPRIEAVNNQFSKPTYAKDLATAVFELINNKPPYGTYHLVNEGVVSWFDYAQEIFKLTKISVTLMPISAENFFTKAKRPLFSALNNNKLKKLRPWPEALAEYLNHQQIDNQ